ncbi:MAG: response regulator [Actinobacteria bacterium]|nr:response regulator [Actinomycetota bacterium]
MRKNIILYAEDDVITRKAVSSALVRAGYEVKGVRTGEEAVEEVGSNLEEYSSTYHPISVVISDINLGEGIDGVSAAQQIREMACIPILFYSGENKEEIEDRIQNKVGRYAWFLGKPADTGSLVFLVGEITAMELDIRDRGCN